MNTITVMHTKGGIGKTTFAVHIAAGLAARGNKVVLMDADMQANATTALGITPQPHIHDLLVRHDRTDWSDVLTPVPAELWSQHPTSGLLFVCASDKETRNIPNSTTANVLETKLNELDDVIDYVVFDTSPLANMMHSMIYASTDYILIPTQLERHSAEAIEASLSSALSVRSAAAKMGEMRCQVLGVVPNLQKPNVVLHREYMDALTGDYGDLIWDPIPQRIAIAEACAMNQTVNVYAPGSDAAHMMDAVVDNVLLRIHEIEVTHA